MYILYQQYITIISTIYNTTRNTKRKLAIKIKWNRENIRWMARVKKKKNEKIRECNQKLENVSKTTGCLLFNSGDARWHTTACVTATRFLVLA